MDKEKSFVIAEAGKFEIVFGAKEYIPMRIMTFMATLAFCLFSTAYSQPDLPWEIKAGIYRIVTPVGPEHMEATSVLFRHGEHVFLLVNEHVVRLPNGQFADSVILFLNKTLENGDVVSGPERITLYTTMDNKDYLFKSEIEGIDLALLPVSKANSTIEELPKNTQLGTIPFSSINSSSELMRIRDLIEIVTLIGYPGKGNILPIRSPEYLWGDLVALDSFEVVSNAPTSQGSSGSPVIGRLGTRYILLGINKSIRHRDGKRLAVGITIGSVIAAFKDYFDKNR